MVMKTVIADLIQEFGSQQRLAEACGVTQVAISKLLRADRVSAEMAVRIEAATNGKIGRWRLRPDLWSKPQDGEAA